MNRIGVYFGAAAIALAASAAYPVASLASPGPGASRPAAATAAPPDWMIAQSALTLLGQTGPLGKAGLTGHQLQELFGNSRTFVIHPLKGAAPGVHGAKLTVSFASYAVLKSTIDGPGLPAGTKAVIYDNEDWSLTPPNEQKNPAKYEQLAAGVVHAHHLLFISTPAVDLTKVLAPHDSDHYAAYLKLGLAASAARYADAIDIQAQGSETSLGTFTPFVKAAAAQARKANRHIELIVGLSTNPSGQKVSSKQFTKAFDAVRAYVNGYWLNIPAKGTACPNCGTPKPAVALPLLRSLLS